MLATIGPVNGFEHASPVGHCLGHRPTVVHLGWPLPTHPVELPKYQLSPILSLTVMNLQELVHLNALFYQVNLLF